MGFPDCEFRTISPDLTPDRQPDDMVMLIGDCGLRADAGDREVIDLGEAWHDWTGLPFVYAIWLLPPNADAGAVVPLLKKAYRLGQNVDDGSGVVGNFTGPF